MHVPSIHLVERGLNVVTLVKPFLRREKSMLHVAWYHLKKKKM